MTGILGSITSAGSSLTSAVISVGSAVISLGSARLGSAADSASHAGDPSFTRLEEPDPNVVGDDPRKDASFNFQCELAATAPLEVSFEIWDIDLLGEDDILGWCNLSVSTERLQSTVPLITWHVLDVMKPGPDDRSRADRVGSDEIIGTIKVSISTQRIEGSPESLCATEAVVYSWSCSTAVDDGSELGLIDSVVEVAFMHPSVTSERPLRTPVQWMASVDQESSFLSRAQWSPSKLSAFKTLQDRLGRATAVRLQPVFEEAFERFRFDRGFDAQCNRWFDSALSRSGVLDTQIVAVASEAANIQRNKELGIAQERASFFLAARQLDEASAFQSVCDCFFDSLAGAEAPAPDIFMAVGMAELGVLLAAASTSDAGGQSPRVRRAASTVRVGVSVVVCMLVQLLVPAAAVHDYLVHEKGPMCPSGSPPPLKLAAVLMLTLFGFIFSSSTAIVRQVRAFGPSPAFSQRALFCSYAVNAIITLNVYLFTYLLFVGLDDAPAYVGFLLNMLAGSYIADLDDMVTPVALGVQDDELRQFCTGAMLLAFIRGGELERKQQWARNLIDGWGGHVVSYVTTATYMATVVGAGFCV